MILKRLLVRHANRFPKGKRVKVRGSPKRGVVLHVITKEDEMPWDGGSPQFIVVQLDNEDTVSLFHAKDLKVRN